MTGSLLRRVQGYPSYSFVGGTGALAVNATATYNLPSGPGEILGFAILKYAGTVADFYLLNCKIIIDAVTYFDYYLSALSSIHTTLTAHNLHATNDVQSALLSAFSFRLKMSYESSASIAFKNQGAASLSLGVGVHNRRGS